ncbi:MAG TPA: histidinol-phosphate transaminase [Patescibacteria group bacterium]|nr:histidinol-phosphate transaminase [Patescibacteria group bacterium]
MSVLGLARPELLALSPYSSARMEATSGEIWLNANESPWNPMALGRINRYPEPQPPSLLEAMADMYGVNPTRLFVGRGSDEPIDLLTRAFCRAGIDSVLVAPPTFGMYAVAAQVQGARVRSVPLLAERGFAFDVEAMLSAVDATTRIVYACTPNNPTGNSTDPQILLDLAERIRDRALLVVDEAYIEFSLRPSLATHAGMPDNLVVLRTLSKAHGLAGVRIGAAIAAPDVIGLLRRIMAPYPLPEPSIDAAMKALSWEARQLTQARIGQVRSERERMHVALSRCEGVREVLPSDANFLAVRFDDPARRYLQLAATGVIVRKLMKYSGLEDALRISIGTQDENDAVLAALDVRKETA